MRRTFTLLALALALGCGDGKAGTAGTGGAGGAGAGGAGAGGAGAGGAGGAGAGGRAGAGGAAGDPTPAASCVKRGDAGNARGVGTYCTPTGNECEPFPYAGLCLAAVGQDQWFCSRIGCDATTDCGMGAGCLITPEGSACVPCRCDTRGTGCGGAGGTGGSGGAGGAG